MEKRLMKKVAGALGGVLRPHEQLLIGSNGFHPRLTSGVGFYLTALLGVAGGTLVQSITGWGAEALVPAVGVGLALLVRWLSMYRTTSGTQPAGATPLVGLTDQRLIFVQTDFWGRPTGSRPEMSIAEMTDIFVKKPLLGLPTTIVEASNGRTIHYQVRYGDRIAAEIERLQATR